MKSGIDGIENFKELGSDVIKVVGKANKAFLYDLWFFVVEGTPVFTGAMKFSWKMTPGKPSTYKPPYKKAVNANGGIIRMYPDPEYPNIEKYTDRWNNYFLVNNQNYVQVVNDDETKADYGYEDTYQFIEYGIEKAVRRAQNRVLKK